MKCLNLVSKKRVFLCFLLTEGNKRFWHMISRTNFINSEPLNNFYHFKWLRSLGFTVSFSFSLCFWSSLYLHFFRCKVPISFSKNLIVAEFQVHKSDLRRSLVPVGTRPSYWRSSGNIGVHNFIPFSPALPLFLHFPLFSPSLNFIVGCQRKKMYSMWFWLIVCTVFTYLYCL